MINIMTSRLKKYYNHVEPSGEPFKKIKGFTYYLSDKPNKKLKVFVNNKWIHFGDARYMHFRDKTKLLDPNLQHFDEARRKRYIMRATNIKNKNGDYTHLNPESPNYHALNILW